MKKSINTFHISGVLYESKLELKETGPNSKTPGTKYISGTIDIATDDAMVNIVPVHFTYVTETTKGGGANATYTTLFNILDKKYGSIMENGAENAVKLKVDSSLALNEFYSDKNGEEVLVSAKRAEGGFVHAVNVLDEEEKERNKFTCDMLITNVNIKEADEERGLPEKGIVKGAIFDFRNALLPVEFSVIDPKAIAYFESLEASSSNPTFTKVWGKQVSETIVRKIVEESAFGEDSVREVKSSRKDFVLTGAMKQPYDWDTEETMTAQDLKEAIANREIVLADIKKRRDDYKAAKNTGAVAKSINNGEFNF